MTAPLSSGAAGAQGKPAPTAQEKLAATPQENLAATPDRVGADPAAGSHPASEPQRGEPLEQTVRRLEAEVRRLTGLAHTDELTGLPNRRALEVALARELARSRRARKPLCLAIIDLDRFKAVNDAHGHPAGDRLLRQAAAAWHRELRGEDILARNAGDEFTVVLADCPLEQASEVIERLRAATPGGQTCSAGVVRWNKREPAEALIARADRALYAAKHAGRNAIAAGQ